MEQLIQHYADDWLDLHPVRRASMIHIEFVKIHPFIDGNGRTARLLLNFELMKNGYPPIVIEKGDRAEYYSALDHAHTMNEDEPFLSLVARVLTKTFNTYLSLV